jgi:hypothetical protein
MPLKPVPEHFVARVERLLAVHPDASDAQLARFADMSVRDFRLRMAADSKFAMVVRVRRALIAIEQVDGGRVAQTFADAEPPAYSAVPFVGEDRDAHP